MKLLQYEDIPRWYSIFWDFKKSGLFIKIHNFYLKHTEFTNWAPYFSNIETKFKWEPLFEKLETCLGKEFFGINDSITLEHSDENWLTYRIKLPKIEHITGMSCPKCGGTGRRYPEDVETDEKCMYCDGTKNETLIIFRDVRRVCYSLSVLLNALSIQLNIEVPTSEFQLFTIGSSTGVGNHSHSVGGEMSPKAVAFLEIISDSYDNLIHLPEIENVMYLAHQQLCGRTLSYDKCSFRCYTRGGHIVFSCPGDATEIHTEINRVPLDGRGADIVCHNLDTSIQQLTLLSGLAMLSTLFDNQK